MSEEWVVNVDDFEDDGWVDAEESTVEAQAPAPIVAAFLLRRA